MTALTCLCQTPAAALGSCRCRLRDWREDDSEYRTIVENLKKYDIGYFIYIGGNDSMDTVAKLASYLEATEEKDIVVMCAPTTVDNDLIGTDHCPGFGSAAKSVAVTCKQIARDMAVYDTPYVIVVEAMGRDAGWLAAASALARIGGNEGPDLIYVCEVPCDLLKVLADVKAKMEQKGSVLIVVSEGLKDLKGDYIGESKINKKLDAFGHRCMAGTASVLAGTIQEAINCKVRAVELSLMQRSAAHSASLVDIEESKLLGMKALNCVVAGENGKMVAIRRLQEEPYQVEYITVEASEVANREKRVPAEWITPELNDVTEDMIRYLTPIIQGETAIRYENGMPEHLVLRPKE